MSAVNVYHVTRKNNRWTVRKEGRRFANFIVRSKEMALKWGRSMAAVRSGRLVVHKANGRIEANLDFTDGPHTSHS